MPGRPTTGELLARRLPQLAVDAAGIVLLGVMGALLVALWFNLL